MLARLDEPEPFVDASGDLCENVSSIGVLQFSLLALGHVNRGEPQAGVNAGRAALNISLEINNVWAQVYSVLNLNHALLEVGEYEEALRVT